MSAACRFPRGGTQRREAPRSARALGRPQHPRVTRSARGASASGLWSPRAATNSPFLAPPTKSGLRWARAPRTCTCSKGGVRICHLQPARETWLLSVSARTRAPRPRVPARFSQLRNPGAVARPRPVRPSRFLLCWSHRMLQAHLAFSPPSPAMSYSSQEPWFMRITLTLENAAQVFWNRDRLAERLSSFSHCPALIPGHSAAQDTRPTRLPTPRCSPLYRLCRCCWPRGDLRAHQLAVRPTHRQTNPNPAGIRGLHALT